MKPELHIKAIPNKLEITVMVTGMKIMKEPYFMEFMDREKSKNDENYGKWKK